MEGPLSTFASEICNQTVVQAQLDNEVISNRLNNLHTIMVRAQARGDRKQADKANLRTMEIHLSIFSLADKVCQKF